MCSHSSLDRSKESSLSHLWLIELALGSFLSNRRAYTDEIRRLCGSVQAQGASKGV